MSKFATSTCECYSKIRLWKGTEFGLSKTLNIVAFSKSCTGPWVWMKTVLTGCLYSPHLQQKCTVNSEAGLTSHPNLKEDIFCMPMEGIPARDGRKAHQVGEQQKRGNCIRGAFSVMSTTGSQKLRKRSTSFRFQLSDSGGRFWEELSIQADCSMMSLHEISCERTNSPVVCLSGDQPEEETPSFQRPAAHVPPSTGRQYDTEMELIHAGVNGNLHTGAGLNLPQRLLKSSGPPQGFDAFAEALRQVPDSLLMEVEPPLSTDLAPNPLMALLPQPLLPSSDGDVPMDDDTAIRKSTEIPILERVGESLRQKKLRATQA
ncbi:hypothetical protein JRQ81_001144 [Phrynocephalus forsythii]|uniref:Uncharacterized protein n=1 Tax=Phrynocephalus forsythii TaxID=171643 RepID=A0A9Q1B8S5_9SAUR|nr:hypothetical protein JRQ81_001144 [Phrynocephalus forsythii]